MNINLYIVLIQQIKANKSYSELPQSVELNINTTTLLYLHFPWAPGDCFCTTRHCNCCTSLSNGCQVLHRSIAHHHILQLYNHKTPSSVTCLVLVSVLCRSVPGQHLHTSSPSPVGSDGSPWLVVQHGIPCRSVVLQLLMLVVMFQV